MAAEQEVLASSGQGSARSAGEREAADAVAVTSAGTGPITGADEGFGDEGMSGAGSAGEGAGTGVSGENQRQGNQGDPADELSEEQKRERIPEDIPVDGTGEDVVARQIRELAMQEEDPELREAIWDEYRKHTGIKK